LGWVAGEGEDYDPVSGYDGVEEGWVAFVEDGCQVPFQAAQVGV